MVRQVFLTYKKIAALTSLFHHISLVETWKPQVNWLVNTLWPKPVALFRNCGGKKSSWWSAWSDNIILDPFLDLLELICIVFNCFKNWNVLQLVEWSKKVAKDILLTQSIVLA